MKKLISIRLALITAIILPIASISAADTLDVGMDANGTTIGWESRIMADTTSTGAQAHHVYRLASGMTWYQTVPLRLSSSCELMGAMYADDSSPATVQQIPGADGNSQFDNWPASNVLTYGSGQTYKLYNLLFNGAMGDGSGTTFSDGYLWRR